MKQTTTVFRYISQASILSWIGVFLFMATVVILYSFINWEYLDLIEYYSNIGTYSDNSRFGILLSIIVSQGLRFIFIMVTTYKRIKKNPDFTKSKRR